MEIPDSVSSILKQKSIHGVWRVSPNATVFDAIQLMSDKNVGALLVMEGEELAGIISERDYTRKVILKGRSSKSTQVHEIMTKRVICIKPEANIVACMHLMTQERVRHLPVIEEHHVVGMISIGDLVKRTIAAQEAMIDQLENYIFGTYPA